MFDFEKLLVYNKAKEYNTQILLLIKDYKLDKHLVDQLKRASLIEKNLKDTNKIFIPVVDKKDAFMMSYAQRLITNSESQVTISDLKGLVKNSSMKETIRAIEQNAFNHINLISGKEVEKAFLNEQCLMMVSLESWKTLMDEQCHWLVDAPSVLIIYDKSVSEK